MAILHIEAKAHPLHGTSDIRGKFGIECDKRHGKRNTEYRESKRPILLFPYSVSEALCIQVLESGVGRKSTRTLAILHLEAEARPLHGASYIGGKFDPDRDRRPGGIVHYY